MEYPVHSVVYGFWVIRKMQGLDGHVVISESRGDVYVELNGF